MSLGQVKRWGFFHDPPEISRQATVTVTPRKEGLRRCLSDTPHLPTTPWLPFPFLPWPHSHRAGSVISPIWQMSKARLWVGEREQTEERIFSLTVRAGPGLPWRALCVSTERWSPSRKMALPPGAGTAWHGRLGSSLGGRDNDTWSCLSSNFEWQASSS